MAAKRRADGGGELRKWKLKESKRDEWEEDVQKAAGGKGYVMER